MTPKTLKNSTALLMSVSLAAPAMSQEQPRTPADLMQMDCPAILDFAENADEGNRLLTNPVFTRRLEACTPEEQEAEPQNDLPQPVEAAEQPETTERPEAAGEVEAAAPAPEAEQQAEQPQEAAQAEDAPPAEPAFEGVNELAQRIAEEARQAEVAQDDSDESVDAANRPQSVAAAAQTAPAEVVTETVTEDTARSSGEEFETRATGDAATALRERRDNERDPLTDLQKLALGALGLAAVGTLLDNGDRVVSNSGDRVVAQRDNGEYYVLKDDNTLLRRPGTEVRTERFGDGSTRETAIRPDGTEIVTIRNARGQVLRRVRLLPDGRQVVLFDDTAPIDPVDRADLPIQRAGTLGDVDASRSEDALREALLAAENRDLGRRFSLQQIREIRAVRALVPEIELDNVTFDSGSAVIRASQAEELSALGRAMREAIEENPGEVFLIEGHTDAVGAATYNLALSDRRAESVALALTEYFGVPPENMVIQGYGESNLKVRTLDAERANRRATVRRITPLLQTASAN